MHTFSKRENLALGGAAILLLPALLLNLDLVPLYAEEPRRAVVAMEMLFRHNWLVPTINGEFYYLKPPFFNWILASLYYLTDTDSEFITRLPTVISTLLLGVIIYKTGKKYVSQSFGALTALLFLIASGNLFFNSLLAEIDLFYSLVTYSSLICLFHFQRQHQYYLLFITVYLLGAIGVLTKGAPSLVYTGLSLLVWLSINRDFRKFFSLPHFAGLFVFTFILGGYFYLYSHQGDVTNFMKSLSVESGKRFSGDSIWEYFIQLAWFPLDTLINLLPASLLLIFVVRKSFLKVIRSNPLATFSLVMLAVHFPVYWLPPGGRQRYIIMLYPFIIQILAYFFLEFSQTEHKKTRIFNAILAIFTGMLVLACPVPLFLKDLETIPGLPWITGLCLLSLATILIIQYKFPRSSLITIFFAMIILRMAFNLIVLPVRGQTGKAPDNRDKALRLAELTREGDVCIYRSTYFPMQCTYYMERQHGAIIPRCHDVIPGHYHIVQKILLKDYAIRRDIGKMMENPVNPVSDVFSGDDADLFSGYEYKVVLEFELQKRKYLLVTPVHPHP